MEVRKRYYYLAFFSLFFFVATGKKLNPSNNGRMLRNANGGHSQGELDNGWFTIYQWLQTE